MEILKDIVVSLASNLVWVVLVFAVLYVRDRKKKEQIDRCLEAYLIFLIKNGGLLRYTIYPYIYLVDLKTIQGNMLGIVLQHISQLCTTILEQTQEIMVFLESPKLQEKVLALYHKVIIFHTHVAESESLTNIIVGNPTDLVEPPRQQEEINRFREFVLNYDKDVKELLGLFPAAMQARIPKEILQIMEQKTPLQEHYEKVK